MFEKPNIQRHSCLRQALYTIFLAENIFKWFEAATHCVRENSFTLQCTRKTERTFPASLTLRRVIKSIQIFDAHRSFFH